VSRQQLVHDGAQGIQVRTIGQFDRLNLLWRHVRRAAGNSLDPRNLGIGHQRNAEIDDPHVALEGEHDVAGFDVAVNHAAAVRVVQCARCLVYQFDHIVDAQQIVGTAVGSQGARPVHVLGHDVAVTILFTGVVNRQNVRMLKHADHVRFGQKHLAGDALAISSPLASTL